MKTQFLNDLDLHGSFSMSTVADDFPLNPQPGTFVLKREGNSACLYCYTSVGGLESWYPFSNRTNFYIHTQGLEAATWTVHHGMQTSNLFVQVKDPEGNFVSVSKVDIDLDSFRLDFTTAVKGTVLVVAAASLTAPSVKTSRIEIDNAVVIDSTGVLINGSYAPTAAAVAGVVSAAVAAETQARQDADAVLQTAVAAETQARQDADAVLQTALSHKSADDHAHSKTEIGLGNVDNTSDANKPISAAAVEALALKSAASHSHTKSEFGLGNADNTSDVAKPLSNATVEALALKADAAQVYTKTQANAATAQVVETLIGAAPAALDTLVEIAAQLSNDANAVGALTAVVATKVTSAQATAAAPVQSVAGFTGAVTKTQLAINNLDNTPDSAKPVSTAQAAADSAVQAAAATDATTKANAAATTANWNGVANRPQDVSNLILKGNFEDGVIGTWSNPYAIEAQDAPCPYAKALVLHSRDSYEANTVNVKPGDVFYFSTWMDTRDTDFAGALGFVCFNITGSISTWIPGAGLAPRNGWTQVSGSLTIPAGVVSINPWLQINGPNDGNIGHLRVAGMWLGRHQPGATANQSDATTNNAISSAQAAAISAAAVAAQAKADAAQANAISVAATDATVKANAAVLASASNMTDLSFWKRDGAIGWSTNAEYNRLVDSRGDTGVYGPRGGSDTVWFCEEATGDGHQGGGWNGGNLAPLDQNKTYRFAIPVYKVALGGAVYWGTESVCLLNTTDPANNPYFANANLPVGTWFLLVGFIYPAGSTGHTHESAGIWNCTTGEKTAGGANYTQRAGYQPIHRAYQYYAPLGAQQLFGRPLINVVDGTEPSLLEYFGHSAVLNSVAIATAKASGVQTDLSNAPASILNSSVTLSSLGYTGALKATADITLVGRNVTVSGNHLTKTSGNAAWDADAYSKDGYTGGAYASAVVTNSASPIMLGLNTDPIADGGYAGLDYAIYVAGGILEAYESGAGMALGATCVTGDVLAVTYDGSNVRYLRNGTVLRTVAAVITAPLFFDSCFNDLNSSLANVRFGPMSSNAWGSIGNLPANIASLNGSEAILNSSITLSSLGYTGALNATANQSDATTNNALNLKAPANNPVFTGMVFIPEGSAAAPGLAFVNDGAPDTGLYHISDGVFGITCNTVPQVSFSSAGTTFNTSVKLTSFVETVYTPASGTSFVVNLANGSYQKFITTGNCTITLPPAVAGKSYCIEIEYGGAHTLTWAGGTSLKWPGATAPTATSESGKRDKFYFDSATTATTDGRSAGSNF